MCVPRLQTPGRPVHTTSMLMHWGGAIELSGPLPWACVCVCGVQQVVLSSPFLPPPAPWFSHGGQPLGTGWKRPSYHGHQEARPRPPSGCGGGGLPLPLQSTSSAPHLRNTTCTSDLVEAMSTAVFYTHVMSWIAVHLTKKAPLRQREERGVCNLGGALLFQ